MKLLQSRDNPLIKTWRKWSAAAGRHSLPARLDGVHLCQAWLAHAGQPDIALFDADRLDRGEIAALHRAVDPDRCYGLPAALMRAISEQPSDQGVVFFATPPALDWPWGLDENCVLIDRIQDPGNVGTLLRTCAAVGIKHVILAPGSASAWSPKALRSGQGAHFALQVHEHVDLAVFTGSLAVPLVVTTLDDATDLYETVLPTRCAWVFGNEGQGVAPALQRAAQYRLRIRHDPAIESLNVAMAATLCLFEQVRQARQAT